MNRIGKVLRAIVYIILSLLAFAIGVATFTASVYGSISSIFGTNQDKLIYGPPTAISSGNTPPPPPLSVAPSPAPTAGNK